MCWASRSDAVGSAYAPSKGFGPNTVSDAVMELTSISFVEGLERSGAIWPRFAQ